MVLLHSEPCLVSLPRAGGAFGSYCPPIAVRISSQPPGGPIARGRQRVVIPDIRYARNCLAYRRASGFFRGHTGRRGIVLWLIGIIVATAFTVAVTIYAIDHILAARDPIDSLTRQGGLRPDQDIPKK